MSRTNLDRFITAQKRDYAAALAEIKSGRKKSHWIWYIFPQLKELGRSDMAKHYGIADLGEAKAYLANDTLRNNLIEICEALIALPETNIEAIMDFPDDLKLHSSMTLFLLAEPMNEVFRDVLGKFFAGELDKKTIEILNA